MGNFSYFMPTKIMVCDDFLRELNPLIKDKNVLLLASKRLNERLRDIGCKKLYRVENIPSHPTFENLKEVSQRIKEHDIIVAIGGGSVMDSAKFFSALKGYGSFEKLEFAIKNGELKKCVEFSPIISIPTTSGTSSEITPWATIWDKKEMKKYSLSHEKLFSQNAIYDASLTLSLDKSLTIQTALDALSHAFESLWNKNSNEISQIYAKRSINLIIKYLPNLSKDLENLTLRKEIMKASMYAGLAFSNTKTALAHAMSYYVTLHKNVHHGLACSFTLPLLLEVALKKEALKERFEEFEDLDLKAFFKSLHVSCNFEDYGFTPKDIEELKSSVGSTQRVQNSLISIDELELK